MIPVGLVLPCLVAAFGFGYFVRAVIGLRREHGEWQRGFDEHKAICEKHRCFSGNADVLAAVRSLDARVRDLANRAEPERYEIPADSTFAGMRHPVRRPR